MRKKVDQKWESRGCGLLIMGKLNWKMTSEIRRLAKLHKQKIIVSSKRFVYWILVDKGQGHVYVLRKPQKQMDKLLFPYFYFWHWISQIFLIGLMTRTREDANDQQLKWPCYCFQSRGCLKFYETYKSIKSSSMCKLYFKVF